MFPCLSVFSPHIRIPVILGLRPILISMTSLQPVTSAKILLLWKITFQISEWTWILGEHYSTKQRPLSITSFFFLIVSDNFSQLQDQQWAGYVPTCFWWPFTNHSLLYFSQHSWIIRSSITHEDTLFILNLLIHQASYIFLGFLLVFFNYPALFEFVWTSKVSQCIFHNL